MRVLYVWVVAIISILITTLGWYVANGILMIISAQALADVTGQGLSILTLLQYVVAWWGPLLDIIILVWAIINSQEYDPNSRYL